MSRYVLRVFERTGVAAAAGGAHGFFHLVIGRIGKAKDRLTEGFVELIFFGEQLQAGALGANRRIQHKTAIAIEHRPGNLPVDRPDKAKRAGVEVKRSGIALQNQVSNGYSFPAQREVAELLIERIRVRSGHNIIDGQKRKRSGEDQDSAEHSAGNQGRHGSPFLGGEENYARISVIRKARKSRLQLSGALPGFLLFRSPTRPRRSIIYSTFSNAA